MDLDGEALTYDPDRVLAQGRDAGFQLGEQWIGENARFALTLFKV